MNHPDFKYASEEDTPAYKIFHWNWEVIIPNFYLRSIEDMDKNGVYTSGHSDIDESQAKISTRTTRTIAEMAELHQSGCNIILGENARDAPKIFKICYDHLQDWGHELNDTSIKFYKNIDDERAERVKGELALIAEFMEFIYSKGIKPIPKKFQANSVIDRFMNLGNVSIAAPEQYKAPIQTEQEPSISINKINIFDELVANPSTVTRVKRWRV